MGRSPGPSEEEFQDQVIQLARLLRWRVAHFRSVRIQRQDGAVYWSCPVQADGKGFPDLVLVKPPRILVAELKVGKNACTLEQAAWIEAFVLCGVQTFVWRPENWKEIESELGVYHENR